MSVVSFLDRLRLAVGWNFAVNDTSPSEEFHRRVGAGGDPSEDLEAAGSAGLLNMSLGVGAEAEFVLNASLGLGVNDSSGEANETHAVDYIRDTLWIVVPMTVIYSIILIVGMLGNVVTCVVISRNKSMHTATNFYLFSLAVSDLLLLLTGVPQEIYFYWYRFPYPFGIGICIMANFVAEASANATVLTITAFTVERYIAICKPFLSHTVSRLSRAVRFILAIWMIALSLAVPQALAMHIEEKYNMCTVRHHQAKPFFFVSTLLVFILPMSVITVLYVLIWLQLRRSELVRSNSQWSSSVRLRHSRRKRRSQRTVVTLNGERNDSPGLCSESALSPSMLPQQQQQQQLPCHLSPEAVQPPPNVSSSCPGTPERRGLLGEQKRLFRTTQPRRAAGSLPGGSITTAAPCPAPLEPRLSGGSDDGRINYSNRTQYSSTRHVVKMLVAVVIAFFLCWAPHHAQRLMAVYANEHNENAAIRLAFELLTYTSGIFYYVSTCINPVLYNIMSHKFRAAFQEMLVNYFNPTPSDPLRELSYFRNVSWRSSVPNSRSIDTCSSLRLAGSAGGGVGGVAGVGGAGGAGGGQSRRPSGNEIPLGRPPLRRNRSEETATAGPGPELLVAVVGRAGGQHRCPGQAATQSECARPQRYEPPAVPARRSTTPGDDNEPLDAAGPTERNAPADLRSAGRNVPSGRRHYPAAAGPGARHQLPARHVCRVAFLPQVCTISPPDAGSIGPVRPPEGQTTAGAGQLSPIETEL